MQKELSNDMKEIKQILRIHVANTVLQSSNPPNLAAAHRGNSGRASDGDRTLEEYKSDCDRLRKQRDNYRSRTKILLSHEENLQHVILFWLGCLKQRPTRRDSETSPRLVQGLSGLPVTVCPYHFLYGCHRLSSRQELADCCWRLSRTSSTVGRSVIIHV